MKGEFHLSDSPFFGYSRVNEASAFNKFSTDFSYTSAKPCSYLVHTFPFISSYKYEVY